MTMIMISNIEEDEKSKKKISKNKNRHLINETILRSPCTRLYIFKPKQNVMTERGRLQNQKRSAASGTGIGVQYIKKSRPQIELFIVIIVRHPHRMHSVIHRGTLCLFRLEGYAHSGMANVVRTKKAAKRNRS